jgi:pimeloyl-ACP methyl ester carboxylesterase
VKRLVVLVALLALSAALAFVWLQGGLNAAEPKPAERAAGSQRFGLREYGEETWQPLAAHLPEQVVLLVHGLDEPGDLWRSLAPALRDVGVPTVRFDYPNDQGVMLSSTYLASLLPELRQRGAKQLLIVAHSMGGLVAREYVTNPTHDYREKLRDGLVPRIRTLVMIGTPNHGSPLARFRAVAELREQWSRLLHGDGELLGAFEDGNGEAGRDLLPDSEFLKQLNARELPRDIRHSIIAGIVSPLGKADLDQAAGNWRRGLPGVLHGTADQIGRQLTDVADGMGDGVVSLASTKLDGVDDHVTVHANHITMIRGTGRAGHESPPSVAVVLERVRRTWPGRFALLEASKQEIAP